MKTITISDQCVACGNCVTVCPSKVFVQEEHTTPIAKHPQSCISCGHCEAICNANAIVCEPFREKGNTIGINSTDTLSLLNTLRSIRNFKNEELPQKDLNDIIQAGYNAPTAQNIRQVSIENYKGEKLPELSEVVTSHLEKLTKLNKALIIGTIKLFNKDKADFYKTSLNKLDRITTSIRKGNYHLFHQAPHLIIIHAPKSNHFAKDDCDGALNFIRIAAHTKGYGSCTIGFAMTAAIALSKHLNLPKGNIVLGVIALGKPTLKYNKGIKRNPISDK